MDSNLKIYINRFSFLAFNYLVLRWKENPLQFLFLQEISVLESKQHPRNREHLHVFSRQPLCLVPIENETRLKELMRDEVLQLEIPSLRLAFLVQCSHNTVQK